ncbi:hypothetical protein AA313_de0204562 [Arthrobotrys entomopaga]|nr:hypothetical protein AA313_de0204562 [Arthrobotrys entomopaga]
MENLHLPTSIGFRSVTGNKHGMLLPPRLHRRVCHLPEILLPVVIQRTLIVLYRPREEYRHQTSTQPGNHLLSLHYRPHHIRNIPILLLRGQALLSRHPYPLFIPRLPHRPIRLIPYYDRSRLVRLQMQPQRRRMPHARRRPHVLQHPYPPDRDQKPPIVLDARYRYK